MVKAVIFTFYVYIHIFQKANAIWILFPFGHFCGSHASY